MAEFRLDFCGIGVLKAGTSWVAKCLAEHPAVCMARFKETNFFLARNLYPTLPAGRLKGGPRYAEGFGWYERHFSHRQAGQLCGEFSPVYISDPECAELLHAHNPQMKLLCSFRSPADAAYAAYHQLSRFRPLPSTFEAFLDQFPELLEYGRFHCHLLPFLQRFGRERVHLLLFDDICADPAATFRDICRFLEIDPTVEPPSLRRRVNPRTVLRSRRLLVARVALRAFFGRYAATRFVRRTLVGLGADRAVIRLMDLNEKPGTVPPLAPATRRRLVEYYRGETEALAQLLGRDLSHWNACS